MMVGVAKCHIDHREAPEVMADVELVDDSHRTVQLDDLLADEARRLSYIGLRGRYSAAACRGFVAGSLNCRNDSHRTDLLGGNEHVGHSMLQRLETADHGAELFAGFQIIESGLIDRGHDTRRFGAECGDPLVDGALNDGKRSLGCTYDGILVDRHIL